MILNIHEAILFLRMSGKGDSGNWRIHAMRHTNNYHVSKMAVLINFNEYKFEKFDTDNTWGAVNNLYEAQHLITEFSLETSSSYVITYSSKDFGKSGRLYTNIISVRFVQCSIFRGWGSLVPLNPPSFPCFPSFP